MDKESGVCTLLFLNQGIDFTDVCACGGEVGEGVCVGGGEGEWCLGGPGFVEVVCDTDML